MISIKCCFDFYKPGVCHYINKGKNRSKKTKRLRELKFSHCQLVNYSLVKKLRIPPVRICQIQVRECCMYHVFIQCIISYVSLNCTSMFLFAIGIYYFYVQMNTIGILIAFSIFLCFFFVKQKNPSKPHEKVILYQDTNKKL